MFHEELQIYLFKNENLADNLRGFGVLGPVAGEHGHIMHVDEWLALEGRKTLDAIDRTQPAFHRRTPARCRPATGRQVRTRFALTKSESGSPPPAGSLA